MKIIGISGISGSGKSRLTDQVALALGEDALILHQDNFYRDQTDVPFENRVSVNYDEPQSIEFDLLFENVKRLQKNENVKIPIYDFGKHTRSDKQLALKPTKYLIVEGTMIYAHKALNDLIDLKLYVDTPMDIAIVRRMTRDIDERDRSAKDIQAQYFNTVRKGMYKYTIAHKDEADIIISGEKDVLSHLDFITKCIKIENN